MGERHTVYLGDEELKRFVEQYADVVGGKSELFKMGLRHLKAEKQEVLESLKPADDLEELT